MVLLYIIRFLRGYLYIELSGMSHERFINMCRHHNIYIWKLVKEDGGCNFCILKKDYRKIKDIAQKTGTRPHIVNRIGLPFIINNICKKKTLFPALIIFAAIIYGASLFVWDITITGQCRHTYEELIEYLHDEHYSVGMLRSRVDGNRLEMDIRNHFDDISWVSVELSGCNIHVRLIESDVMENKDNQGNAGSDIIASSDGIVTSMITRRGTPKVQIGDSVTKGQVLVSGTIDICDDGGNVTGNEYVYADADIGVDTVYAYNDSIDLLHDVRRYTGREKSYYDITLNDNVIFFENLLNEFETYNNYDIINECVGVNWLGGVLERADINRKTYREYELISETYGKDEVLSLSRTHLHRYINELWDRHIIVNDNRVTVNIENGKCVAAGIINVTEPQLERQDIASLPSDT